MATFIEVTSKDDGRKRLIAIHEIKSILEEPDGTAFIEMYLDKRAKGPVGMYCAEKYVDIYNELATYEFII